MNQLNPQQREAVRYIDSPLLVLAGAGSGKTSVITQKIAYLIRECELPAHRIIAVTFTNKAAREMKERVGKLLIGTNSRGLTVSTFHTLGLKILKAEKKHLGLRNGFTIFDSQDSQALLKDLMHQQHEVEGDKDTIQMVQQQISNWKNQLITPEHAISYAENDHQRLAAVVYETYNRHLQAYNAVDFDDLITRPTLLFQQNAEVLERWQNRTGYLLVDEYQDTNTAQYQLVKLLIGVRGALCVVGDDDQSIYAWRGAQPENLALLSQDFPNLRVIKLEQNYRSMGRILKAANQVIGNNNHVFEKKLWSELGYGDPIRVIRNKNEEAEAEKIAGDILTQRIQTNRQFKDFAVLYRSNHQSRLLELKLQALGIPYKISGGTSFFARTEIKDIMAYLRLIINPDDDNAFLRIINTPRREIGPATLEKLANYAGEQGISLLHASEHLAVKELLSGKAFSRLQQFSHWLNRIRQNCYQNDPIASFKECIEDMDYEDWLHQQSSNNKVAEKRMDNIWQLVKSIQTMMSKDEDEKTDFEAAINKLVLIDMLEQQNEEDDSDRVQLMTLHASKGLEFPQVYLMGVEEDILPHRNSINTDTIEEERRLMYVGITRAKRNLTITMCNERKQFGEKIECVPSRFLDELPQDDLSYEGAGAKEKPKEEKQQIGKAHLDNLRALLS